MTTFNNNGVTTSLKDKNLLRFFLLGVGTLLPFNVFITAKKYFDVTLLRHDGGDAAAAARNGEGWFTFTKDSFENAFSFSYTMANLATLIAMNRMRVFDAGRRKDDDPRRRREEDVNEKSKLYDRLTTYPLLACAVCFFATALLALDEHIKGTFVVSFATFNLVLFGIFTGLVQSGSFALAATRERKFSTSVVSGQALSGVLASFVALTCSGFNFAALYFGLSGLACLLCAKGGRELVLEMKKENMTSNMGDDSINSGNISTQQYAPVAILEEDKEEEKKKKKKKKESNNALSENDLEFNVEDERSNARLMGASAMSSSSNATTEASEGTEGAADEPPIKKETWLFRFAVFLTFTVTLTAFPAITSSIVTRAEMNNNSGSDDSNGASTDGDYWTSFLFLLFNLGDLAGRVFEGSSYAHSRGLQNVTGQVAFRRSLYRIVFVPLLASCNVNRSGWRIPRVFSFDSFPILFVFLLGFTNGFNAACSMALGPQTLSSDHHSPRSDEIENEDIEIENPPSLVSSSLTTERTNEDEEKEDVAKSEEGAFLGTMLSAGIAFGSVVSVLVCGIFTSGGYL
jgi:equilibrative nucleoside transporter 1/2/3